MFTSCTYANKKQKNKIKSLWIVTANTILSENVLRYDGHKWILGIRTIFLQPPTSPAMQTS